MITMMTKKIFWVSPYPIHTVEDPDSLAHATAELVIKTPDDDVVRGTFQAARPPTLLAHGFPPLLPCSGGLVARFISDGGKP